MVEVDEQTIITLIIGKGRCIDNVYIERLWQTLKYAAIYLNEYGGDQTGDKALYLVL